MTSDSPNNNNVSEKDIWDAMAYADDVFTEFGINHPLLKECLSDIINLINRFPNTHVFSKELTSATDRFFKRY